jgi:CheY-like chemotaxis protein
MNSAKPLEIFCFDPELPSFRADSPIHESKCNLMRILVVDDDRVFCQLLAELLESHGYEVDCANHALEAFKKSQQTNYDLFVVDVRMPIVLGTELAKGLKEQNPAAKIVLISAFSDEFSNDQANKLDLPLLCKPFTNEAFLDLVAKTAKV